MTTATTAIVIGTRIDCVLHWAGRGTVYAIHGEQRPETVRVLGGVAHMGGAASFDVVFDNGRLSSAVPESIIRGVQWHVLAEVATAEQIAASLAQAHCQRAAEKTAAENAKARFAAEVERLRTDPAHAALEQADDKYSGKVAAKNIRTELRATFGKAVKFSVRNRHGSIDISWTDGPTTAQVEKVTRKYQSGNFDGMNDIYEYSENPWNRVFGGSKYVFTQRDFSAALITRAIAAVFEKYAGNLEGVTAPTAEDYQQGRCYAARIPGLGGPFDQMDVAIRAQASEMEA